MEEENSIVYIDISSSSDDEDLEINKMHISTQQKNPEKKVSRPRIVESLKTDDCFMKEMSGFDPENSNREKRKLSKKLKSNVRFGHDEEGKIIGPNVDLCDCLSIQCLGCFFPCPNCRSCKCGPDCRKNRRYLVESIENPIDNTIVKNPYKQQVDSINNM